MEVAIIILGALILAGIVWLGFQLRSKPAERQPDPAILLIQQQIQSFQERIDRFGENVNQRLHESSQSVGERLDQAAKVFGEVQKGIGKISQTNEQILGISKNIASLEDMLRAPKFRGGLGELFLADLLSQIMPPEHYVLQHRFKSGEIVDAAIRVGEKMVPVDAKFPYDNFKRIAGAESELERSAAAKQFLKDVKGHVDKIATKYICADEGTYDFALMYIPAENIYYEIIIKDNTSDEDHPNLSYCLSRNVIPVSPNSFYAYLRTILLGLRGLKVEARAGEILGDLNRLRVDFEKFSASFELVGTHMDNARKKYDDSAKALGKLEVKLQQIETGKDKILSISDH